MENASEPDAILIEMEAGFYNKAEYNNATCSNEPDAARQQPVPLLLRRRRRQTVARVGRIRLLRSAAQADREGLLRRYTRQFFAGYSSGGWMAHQLGCQFPDVLRAQASVTGGLPPVDPRRRQDLRRQADRRVPDPRRSTTVEHLPGSVAALDRLLALNECGGATMGRRPSAPYTITGVPNTATFNCVQYTGCPAEYPIVFCTSRGPGAQRPDHRRRPRLLGVLLEAVVAMSGLSGATGPLQPFALSREAGRGSPARARRDRVRAWPSHPVPSRRRSSWRKPKPSSSPSATNELIADKREFSTGSFGWYHNGKTTITVDGKPLSVQVGINLTVVGSKEAER